VKVGGKEARVGGGRDFKTTAGIVLAVSVVMSLSSCSHLRSARYREAHDVEIFYSWGVEGRDRLDTLTGTATCDCRPLITGRLDLSDEERAIIAALADSVDFWKLPRYILPPDTTRARCRLTPCSSFLLCLTVHGRSFPRTHTSAWSSCQCDPCVERDRAMILGRRIYEIVKGKDAWKALEANCRHLPMYL